MYVDYRRDSLLVYIFDGFVDKFDIFIINFCEFVIVVISVEVKKLLMELLFIKIYIYFYFLYCSYLKNIIICIYKFLVFIIRRNVVGLI